MKKRFWALLLVAVMCLTVFGGCQVMKGLEKDIEVTVVVEGVSYGPYVVNVFNNAIVPDPLQTDPPLTVEEGYRFVGWTAQENWKDLPAEQVKLTSNLYLIRYNEIKDYANAEGKVTLYPVTQPKPVRDLVVAWYNKTSTSYLSQDIMDQFEADMLAYITSQGKDVNSLDIEVRGYEGNVGASIGAVMKDGDVDILVGWNTTSNLTGTGGMPAADILENIGDIYINNAPEAGPRYAARLSDTELVNLVYDWIIATYQKVISPTALTLSPATAEIEVGKTQMLTLSATPDNAKTDVTWSSSDDTIATVDGGVVKGVAQGTVTITATSALDGNVSATASITVVPAQVQAKETLKVAWYDKEGTSGLTASLISEVETGLDQYLAAKGYTADTLEVVFKGYTGNVGPSCAEIMADGDVDIMLGWNHTITATTDKGGHMPESMILENVSGIKINPDKERYAARLTDDYVTKLAFWWIQNTYKDDFAGAEPIPDGTKLVIGWYSNTGTSGLDQTIMTKFETALKAYLTSAGYDLTKINLEIRDIGSGKVAEVGETVNNAGDYDILLGMGKNITSGAGIAVKQGEVENQYRVNVTMGGEARNIAWLESSTSPLASVVWDWLFGTDTTDAWLSGAEAAEIGFSYTPTAKG